VTGNPSILDGELFNPFGIAVDASGNIYVADAGNNRLVKYNSSGVFQGWIGYVATGHAGSTCPATGSVTGAGGWCSGGPAKSGSSALAGGFNDPWWLTVDTNGILWVIDTGNYRIEKFNASTGAYLDSIPEQSGVTNNGPFGVEPSGKSIFVFEAVNWGSMTLNRYSTATHALIGTMAPLASAASPTGGQAGCTSLATPGLAPTLWCLGPTSLWEDMTTWAASTVGQIVVDANAQNLYFFDDDNFRIVKLPIGN
jgi:DNA-binding beta-propeller fold protein YncE